MCLAARWGAKVGWLQKTLQAMIRCNYSGNRAVVEERQRWCTTAAVACGMRQQMRPVHASSGVGHAAETCGGAVRVSVGGVQCVAAPVCSVGSDINRWGRNDNGGGGCEDQLLKKKIHLCRLLCQFFEVEPSCRRGCRHCCRWRHHVSKIDQHHILA